MIASSCVLLHHPRPCADVRLSRRLRALPEAELVKDGAAAARSLRDHHLAAMTGQHANGGLVDLRPEYLLRAAVEQGDALAPRSLGGEHLRPVRPRGRADALRYVRRHGAHASWHQPCEGAAEPTGERCQAEKPRVRYHRRQQPSLHSIGPWSDVGLFDVLAGGRDEVAVVDPGRTCGHAGEAGEAAVEMLHDRRGGRPAALQHLLRQIDAPARAIQLIAEQEIGRARGEAEAAVHAGAQDVIGLAQSGIGERRLGEIGLHRQTPSYIRPGLRTWPGSNASFTRRVSDASAGGCG